MCCAVWCATVCAGTILFMCTLTHSHSKKKKKNRFTQNQIHQKSSRKTGQCPKLEVQIVWKKVRLRLCCVRFWFFETQAGRFGRAFSKKSMSCSVSGSAIFGVRISGEWCVCVCVRVLRAGVMMRWCVSVMRVTVCVRVCVCVRVGGTALLTEMNKFSPPLCSISTH
jgi:hypothetical protein